MSGHELRTPPTWKSFFVKEGRTRPVWLLISYLPIVGLVALVLLVPGITLLDRLGYPSLPLDQAPTSWRSLVKQTSGIGLSIASVVIGTWIWRKYLWRRDMAGFGLGMNRHGLGDLGMGLVVGAGLTTGIFVIEWLAGWIQVRGLAWQARPAGLVAMSLYLGIITAVMAAIAEEILLRGYVLQTLEAWIGLRPAVIISSTIFGIGHLVNPTATGWANYVIPFTVTLGGLMFASAYLVSRSLWLPMGLHFSWNLFEYQILALTGVAPDRASILITEITGPPFWVGLHNSSFGPEVSALGVAAMALCIGMFWWMRKRSSRPADH